MKGKRSSKRVRHTTKRITLTELHKLHNGICAGCGAYVPIECATRDHKRPKSKGGSNKRKNLQLMCWDCNQYKADSMVA